MTKTETLKVKETMTYLSSYQKCVNRIDDYLEYRFKMDSKETVVKNVKKMISDLTKELKQIGIDKTWFI